MNELLGWYGLPKINKDETHQLTLSQPIPASLSVANESLPKTTAEEGQGSQQSKRGEGSTVATAFQFGNKNPVSASVSQKTVSKPSVVTLKEKAYSLGASTGCGVPGTKSVISQGISSEASRGRKRKEGTCVSPKKVASFVTAHNSHDTNNNNSNSHVVNPDLEDDDDDDDIEDDDEDDDDDDDEDDIADDVDNEDDDDLNNELNSLISPELTSGGLGSAIVCSWCQKDGTKLFTLDTPSGVKSFCSEVCFTQCRRASFKKNKVCDWCKHVRHTVNFVDFQEGNLQLQFCSEKCLNQYKMNIFCTEARQHLEQIQKMTGNDSAGPKFTNSKGESQGEILITPELWFSGNSGRSNEVRENGMEGCDKNDNMDPERDGDDRGEYEEEKEPGEVRERESGAELKRYSSADSTLSKSAVDENKQTKNKNKMYDSERIHRTIRSEIDRRRSLSGSISNSEVITSRLAPTPTSPAIPSSVNDGRNDSEAQINQNNHIRRRCRSRERIRRLLVGESLQDRAQSPSHVSHSNRGGASGLGSNSPRLTSQTEAVAAARASLNPASVSLVSALNPEQQLLLGHPMFSHWATSQLLAMMPSTPGGIPSSLFNPSATASQLAGMGLSNGSQLLHPSLLGASPIVNPLSAASVGVTGTNTQSKIQSELRPSTSNSYSGPTGTTTSRSVNQRVGVPSPMSSTSSQSSRGTPGPVPNVGSSHFTMPPELLHQLLVNANIHNSGDEQLKFLHSYLASQQHQLPLPLGFPAHSSASVSNHQLGAHPPNCSSDTPTVAPLSDRPTLNRTDPRMETNPEFGARVPPPNTTRQHPPNIPFHPPQGYMPPTGIPPVTVMVPYPLAIPIPIPIPIPLPISPEKLASFFQEKAKQNTGEASGSTSNTTKVKIGPQLPAARHRSQSSSSSGSKLSPPNTLGSPSTPRLAAVGMLSPRGPTPSSYSSSSPRGDNFSSFRTAEHFSAVDPILMLRRDVGQTSNHVPPDLTTTTSALSSSSPPASISPCPKRTAHQSSHSLQIQSLGVDLSKRLKSELSEHTDENEAMDLRKVSSRSSDYSDQSLDIKLESHSQCDGELRLAERRASLNASPGVANLSLQTDTFPPRIHIVLNEQPPLNTAPEASVVGSTPQTDLPPLPEQSTYSSRRSRILDAPSVPKRTRSPSPERRYVRTVPRDMVEAARRRGLRARVRSK